MDLCRSVRNMVLVNTWPFSGMLIHSDDGLGDIHDFVHAQYDTQGLEQPLQFLIDFIGNEADADATFDAVAQPVIDGAYAGRSCSWDLFIGPVHRIGFLIISSGKLPII